MNIETVPMFAIPLGYTTLPKELCDQLKPLEGFGQNGTENDIGTKPIANTFNVLVDHPHIERDILEIFALWVNNLYNRPKQKWIVTTSWITENLSGRRLTSHNHLNSLWSAVLYFDTITEDFAPLVIESPIKPQGIQVYPEGPLNPFTSDRYECPMKEGTILFFPSYCKHFHDSYEQKKGAPLRRSLALNFLPIGFFGSGDSMLDTNWLRHDDI